MKKIVLATIFAAGVLFATDFASMSTEDLVGLRGTVSAEEQEAFKSELQSRVSAMTSEEREALGITAGSNGSQSGNAHGTTARDGSGIGSMGAASGGLGVDAGGLGSGMGSASGGFGGGMGNAGGGMGGHGGRR